MSSAIKLSRKLYLMLLEPSMILCATNDTFDIRQSVVCDVARDSGLVIKSSNKSEPPETRQKIRAFLVGLSAKRQRIQFFCRQKEPNTARVGKNWLIMISPFAQYTCSFSKKPTMLFLSSPIQTERNGTKSYNMNVFKNFVLLLT